MRVLLVFDDPAEQAVLALALQFAGLQAVSAPSMESALASWRERPAEAVILAQHGDICPQVTLLRTVINTPLVLLVDDLTEDKHVALLGAGATLVLSRFSSTQLLMRQIPALLQHLGTLPKTCPPMLNEADFTLDPNTRTLHIAEKAACRLSPLEFKLLYALMSHPGQTLTTNDLVTHTWGYDEGDGHLLRNLVWHLRRKIEPDPKTPVYILTIPCVGYMFNCRGHLRA